MMRFKKPVPCAMTTHGVRVLGLAQLGHPVGDEVYNEGSLLFTYMGEQADEVGLEVPVSAIRTLMAMHDEATLREAGV